jgi:hypothetical protein
MLTIKEVNAQLSPDWDPGVTRLDLDIDFDVKQYGDPSDTVYLEAEFEVEFAGATQTIVESKSYLIGEGLPITVTVKDVPSDADPSFKVKVTPKKLYKMKWDRILDAECPPKGKSVTIPGFEVNGISVDDIVLGYDDGTLKAKSKVTGKHPYAFCFDTSDDDEYVPDITPDLSYEDVENLTSYPEGKAGKAVKIYISLGTSIPESDSVEYEGKAESV